MRMTASARCRRRSDGTGDVEQQEPAGGSRLAGPGSRGPRRRAGAPSGEVARGCSGLDAAVVAVDAE